MLDILIQNGTLIDGTGKKAFQADIGITDGKITFHTEQASARQVINAHGKIVCPGFIDFHSHGDMVLGQDFAKLCKVSQGITTEIAGQCGSSMFPVRPEKLELYKTLLSVGTATYPDDMPNWITFQRYLEYAKQLPLAANIKFLVGHGSLRLAVMGYACRKPTVEELETMKHLLRECMEHGALGMSSGLIYTPSAYAETDELAELAKVVAEYDGLYATHMRNESYDVVNSVKEAIEIGRRSGVRVSISHHKVCGKQNWGLSRETLALVDKAIQDGIRITLDQYPYTASMTHLNACIPPWYFTEGIPAMAEKLKDPEVRKKLEQEINDPTTPFDNYVRNCGGYEGIFISSCPVTHEAEGKFLSDYAAETGVTPFQALCNLLAANGGVGTAIYHCMSEEDLDRIISYPHTVVGTDGICRAMEEKAHPRAFGTFVRAICHFQKERNLMSLEEIIRKMTSLPASRAMLENKGALAEGYDADLVIFDYDTLEDTPNYTHSNQVCQGIESVIVNGTIVYEHGALTGAHGGKILLHKK
ncbi:D-aminoacylase [Anaerotignum lactatifermentans]|uniref:D-aminoacylase n=1 Tax=Anaerotignum lactatifermentans TaxID=160404 RepID=A0ABS2G7X8_9FIRM|nr:D-aminoacylase [Anaerotignum lactatifermentans]MBM6829191.1 D-aminoacylase [Anaerotignum lactatifermentans]MBM6877569.1 D-aminoacylase [Anaerotignum lactatifermentans]MBM6950769.1 D-aminoacylase [Anaerotignum lactatifermentans]